jgi:hypothetical protein
MMKKILWVFLAQSLLASCGNNGRRRALAPAKTSRLPEKTWTPMGALIRTLEAATTRIRPYYGHPDFYNATSNEHLSIITHYKTFQQTAEYTCGPASILMALYNLGSPLTPSVP